MVLWHKSSWNITALVVWKCWQRKCQICTKTHLRQLHGYLKMGGPNYKFLILIKSSKMDQSIGLCFKAQSKLLYRRTLWDKNYKQIYGDPPSRNHSHQQKIWAPTICLKRSLYFKLTLKVVKTFRTILMEVASLWNTALWVDFSLLSFRLFSNSWGSHIWLQESCRWAVGCQKWEYSTRI